MMGPHMGPPMMGHQQPMAGPPPPGVEPGPFMSPGMENSNQISAGPTVVEQQKVVYAAAPVITVEKKKEKKKKKKKKTDGETSEKSGSESAGPSVSSQSSITSSSEGNSAPTDMDVAPASTMVGGIVAASLPGQPPLQPGMMAPPQLAGMMPGQIPGMMGAPGMPGMPGPVPVATPGGKKEKKKKEKKFIRLAANTAWEDPTLAEWAQDDFRMFCGDLGNEVTDETLVRAFNKYPSFLKAKVVRDRRTNKTKGYGFVSFKDPVDFTRAMREMNGKYVGNRPIKLRKSSWRDRNLEVVRKKEKEKKRLGLK